MNSKLTNILVTLKVQYGVALTAAPIFCVLYNHFDSSNAVNHLWFLQQPTTFFLLIVFYPIIEELAFRGVIQEFLGKQFSSAFNLFGISIANILTSVLFVGMHLFHHPLIWALATFIPSLVFGYFKEKFNHILPSIILHIFYNLCYFLIVSSPN